MRCLTRWFTHLAVFNVSGLIGEVENFSFPDVSSSPSLPLSSPPLLSGLFQSLQSPLTGNNQRVSWTNFLHSCFSIPSFIVFPLSSHTVVSHLSRPSCHKSGHVADSQSGGCRLKLSCCFFSPSFVFVTYRYPTLALRHIVTSPFSHVLMSRYLSLSLLTAVVSSPENFTLPHLFSE